MAKLPSKKSDVSVSTIDFEGKKIKLKQFTGREEKVLLTARLKKDRDSLINAVLDIVTSCTDVDARELPIGAVQYLFTEIRSVSHSNVIEFSIACQSCGKAHPVKIGTHQLNIPEKFTDELVLDSHHEGSPVKIVLRTPKSKDMFSGTPDDDNSEIRLIMACVEEIYVGEDLIDEEFTLEEFEAFFMSLKNVYTRALAFVLDYPKITYENKFKCIECGEDNEVVVKDLKDFFSS
uniref:Baseplate hub n=1 Tax=Rhizobium phage IG49 TaxID=3129228 RepID=A0AAU8HZ15_9CAUD